MTPLHDSNLTSASRRKRRRLLSAVGTLLVIWAALFAIVQRDSSESSSMRPELRGADGPPWRQGAADARFTIVLYADLECPYCKAYSPYLRQWVDTQLDVNLHWHHLPLAVHEPAASTEARLTECAAESGGHRAFWQAVEWIYMHTRSDGQGLPNGLRYPDLTPVIEQCLASERPDAAIRAQAEEAMKSGVTATPSVRLLDRHTGQAILLQGPIEGDSLLSAMDMLAAGEPDTTSATEMPADDVGDIPGSPRS
ncbi:DsbA family protein [Achromobacter xylosoxidans]|uniref:DsbA family protein n=1 Tax=Alcaligenes xylosoxydans xylosoxydans TaxID=85698 RepID=UPI001EECF5F7|nr:DsbA family protein [Achromobacter xylosoxidans]